MALKFELPSLISHANQVLTVDPTEQYVYWNTNSGGDMSKSVYDPAGGNKQVAFASDAYVLPKASTTVLGGVKQGSNITIDVNGVISATASGSGDVVGPGSATDKGVALFDSTTGKLLKNSTSFVQLNNGNVGIGTTSPTSKLDVVSLGTDLGNNYASLTIRQTNASSYGPSFSIDATAGTGGHKYGFVSNGPLDGFGAGILNIYDYTVDISRMHIRANGDVVVWSNLIVNNLSSLKSDGTLGVGTLTPRSAFEVSKSINGTGNTTIATISRIANDYPANSGVGLGFYHTNSLVGGIAGIRRDASTDWSGSLGFYVNTYASSADFSQLTEAMRIKYDGSVGIGTTSPTAVLHLKAGTATANTAPLKFTSGTLNTTAEAGVMEYNNTPHFTNSDAVRRNVVLSDGTYTAGLVVVGGKVKIKIGGTEYNVLVE